MNPNSETITIFLDMVISSNVVCFLDVKIHGCLIDNMTCLSISSIDISKSEKFI